MQAGSGEKRRRLRATSSIDELPLEARRKLEAMFMELGNGLTYQDMTDEMARDGYELSRSAIARYARKNLLYAKRLQEVDRQTRLLLEHMDANPDTNIGRQVNALIQSGLMWRIVEGQEDISNLSVEDAIKLALQAQRAAVYEYRYRDGQVTREKSEGDSSRAELMNLLREELRGKPELLASLERELGGAESAENAEGKRDG